MISIIGRGNVASHLHKALEGITDVTIVNPHTLEELPEKNDIILISVADSAIVDVVNRLPPTDAVIAHTAGSIPMKAVEGKSPNFGVFYPLQTFSKDIPLDYSIIPIFIEGSTPKSIETLKRLAHLISNNVTIADSETRKRLHLASVFACNFTNALAGIGAQILAENGLDISTLLPLMRQTVEKLEKLTPQEAQTGPAARRDKTVVETHLKMLEFDPQLQNIYSLLSERIMKTCNPEKKK
ncbi:MAG: DUF2520 domain-containing protein [Muribaculaceae bacterium]|nr:DUF2520 domain-containing protein [Muribaculaceae bacterium]